MVVLDAVGLARVGVVLGGVAATQLVHVIAGRLWSVQMVTRCIRRGRRDADCGGCGGLLGPARNASIR
jgi:hypothetical protein